MATAFRYRSHLDTAKLLAPAGSLITVLDDLLTQGASPWTKTVNGTNDVTYQAPAGSQVKVRVYDTVASSTCLHARLTAQIGAGAVFPTAAQEAGYYITAQRRIGNSASATYDSEWYGVRTDRFFMIVPSRGTTSDNATYLNAAPFGAGDLPAFNPTDPGFCALFGARTNNITTGLTRASSHLGAFTLGGYSSVAPNGSTLSAPLIGVAAGPVGALSTIANHGGLIPLSRLLLAGAIDATSGSVGVNTVLRGYLPYVFTAATPDTTLTSGDTFTAGGQSFVVVKGNAAGGFGNTIYLMITDGEA